MNKILDWIKKNWIIGLLLAYIAYGWMQNNLGRIGYSVGGSSYSGVAMTDMAAPAPMMTKSLSLGGSNMMYREAAPVEQANRMVVQDTNMSMLVKDVAKAIKEIEKTVTVAGGYMVNKGLSRPEGAASGNISVRVPVTKREDVLEEIRGYGVKVVSENVYGSDVTDEYVDLEARLANLNKTKAKMEAIMDQATRVEDLMSVQNQLNSIQMQIDSLKGQQKYLEQTAKLTLISVSLSTDELALPYAPDGVWRPEVVFKNAVRSMLGTLRSVANLIIWTFVYIPVIILVVLVIWLLRMFKNRFEVNKK